MAGSEPRLERIRPCLQCGAMMPFKAARCAACGALAPGAEIQSERVRSCLKCGALLRFDLDPCPECGTPASGLEEERDRVKPCASCSALIPFDRVWCDRCGELAIPIERDQIPPVVVFDEPAPASAWMPVLLASVALAMGGGALAWAAVEVLR